MPNPFKVMKDLGSALEGKAPKEPASESKPAEKMPMEDMPMMEAPGQKKKRQNLLDALKEAISKKGK